MNKIYVNYGSNPEDMAYQLMTSANIQSLLHPDYHVGIKPNLVVASSAANGATTHPQIIRGIIRFLIDTGIKHITIMESSWVGEKTDNAFHACGYKEIAAQYNLQLLDLKKDSVLKKKAGKFDLKVCKSPLSVDYLINVPVLKAHCQTDMTCCLKNMKGCIPDDEKRRFHTMGLHGPIAALSCILKPDLHIVDSICGDLTFEEGGNPVESNRIILGFNGVRTDSYCAGLLGYSPGEIRHVKLAADMGAGQLVDEDTEIIEYNRDQKPRHVKQKSNLSRQLSAFIEEDSACSACYAALVFALNRYGKSNLSIDNKIKIGQGYRGQNEIEGLGVGNCTQGCRMNIPGCPPKAVDIYDFLQRVYS